MRKIAKFFFQFGFNLILLILQVFPDNNIGNRLRGIAVRPFLKDCGKNFQISKSVHILYPQNLTVGDDVFLGFNSWLNAHGGLDIGDEVMLGPFVAVSTSNHTSSTNGSYRFAPHILGLVQIGEGSWLAAHVTVTANSSIPAFSVIAGGATFVGSADEAGLYVGQPARLKKAFK